MFNRHASNHRSDPEMIAIRDRATAESWPLNDPRANYPAAENYRRSRAGNVSPAERNSR